MTTLLFKDEVFAVVGAAFEVKLELGNGFLEAVYQEAMEFELSERKIPCESQKPLTIIYKGHALKKEYVPDLMCFGQLIVELKAIDRITSKEESQMLNYLKATGLRVGIIINFGTVGKLEWKRYIR